MKAIQQLSQEHEAIKLMLQILEKICDKLEAQEKIDSEHLEKILEFIKVFADRCHHGKEEDLFFPALEKAGIPKEGGPLGVMLIDHDTGRGYVRGMSENLVNPSGFAENARNYINLLREHIDKEDGILYPMAEMHLSEQIDQELLVGFEKIEEERIGKGKHEEFHRLLENLQGVYLK